MSRAATIGAWPPRRPRSTPVKHDQEWRSLARKRWEAAAKRRAAMASPARRGPQVTGLYHLAQLAERRRAVVFANGLGQQPAAWALNLSGAVLVRAMRAGLWEYAPAGRKAKP